MSQVKGDLPALLVPLKFPCILSRACYFLTLYPLPLKLVGGDIQPGCPKATGDLSHKKER